MRPGQRHLYRVSSLLPQVGSSLHPAICITCNAQSTKINNDQSNYHTTFSDRRNGWMGTDWHEDYDVQTESPEDKEQRRGKEKAKKQKSKASHASSEYTTLVTIFITRALYTTFSLSQCIVFFNNCHAFF